MAGGEGETPIRAVRVPDELWDEVRRIASDRDETISDVVRRALEQYVRRWPAD